MVYNMELPPCSPDDAKQTCPMILELVFASLVLKCQLLAASQRNAVGQTDWLNCAPCNMEI